MKKLPPTLEEYRQIMAVEDFKDFATDLIETFYDVTSQHLTQLHEAFYEKDNEAFKRAAHSLKSSSQTFDFTEFTTIAAELETRGCLKDINEIKDLIALCEMEFERSKTTLEVLRSGL